MILEQIKVGLMQVNCYILADPQTRGAMIIDPGDEYDKIAQLLGRKKLKASFIVNTHGHIDHIGAENEFSLPVYIYKDEVPMLKDASLNLSGFLQAPFTVKAEVKALEDNQEITLDSLRLKVLHTPGHTPGGIALLLLQPEGKIVFTGDTLFYSSVGRTDFPGASSKTLINSIKTRLLTLSDDTVVYPGHGPRTTIGQEKKNNPFLG
ncbi:MAG: MBL fold metallo-hydrolase [Candidatus Omnitrophica bacterium]|nr:MBL fold metallo-hydrolase [Candidatus Omnitrophota bacterium]